MFLLFTLNFSQFQNINVATEQVGPSNIWNYNGIFDINYANKTYRISTSWHLSFSDKLDNSLNLNVPQYNNLSNYKRVNPVGNPDTNWIRVTNITKYGVKLANIFVLNCIGCNFYISPTVGNGNGDVQQLLQVITPEIYKLYPTEEIMLIVSFTVILPLLIGFGLLICLN
jgi:hypothetical protein